MKIHIPKPCHEDWDAMSPNQQGAFCKVCAKTVVDFSKMTDAEVLQYFESKGREEKTCGRFNTSQLSPYEILVDSSTLHRQRGFSKAFLATLFIVFSTLFVCKSDTGDPLDFKVVYSDNQTSTMGMLVATDFTTSADTSLAVSTPDTVTVDADTILLPMVMGQTVVPHSIPFIPDDTIVPAIDTVKPTPKLMGKVCIKPDPPMMKGEVEFNPVK